MTLNRRALGTATLGFAAGGAVASPSSPLTKCRRVSGNTKYCVM